MRELKLIFGQTFKLRHFVGAVFSTCAVEPDQNKPIESQIAKV